MVERHSGNLTFSFNSGTLTGTVTQAGGRVWGINLAGARGIAVGSPEPMSAAFPWAQTCHTLDRLRPLRPRDLVRERELANGVELDFRVGGADFRVTMTLSDDRPDEFVFSLQPLPIGRADLLAAELPGPIGPADGSPIQVLAVYRHQGRLFTGLPGALEPEAPHLRELAMPEGRHRLRFFGVLGDGERIGSAGAGYIAIIDENADAQITLRQESDGRVSSSVAWLPSMGTLAYTRTIRYRFQDNPTVTTLARGFREYAKSAGLFKSLKDKIAERPSVGKLAGATACFIGYEACGLDYVGTFRRLREMGHTAFYAFPLYHINCGFDDTFAGMKLIDIRDKTAGLRALGAITASWTYLAGVADRVELQRLASRNADGTMPLNWRIGDEIWPQTCMAMAAQWFAGQGEAIRQADAHHFDTTASNTLMECYAPSHPLNRRGDRAARIELFREATRHGCIVGSEGVKDWAVPHYDIGSNKEIPVLGESPAYRIVPAQHLVYHDALFSLWWEVHPYDCPHFGIGGHLDSQSLTDLLYGDMPLIFPVGRQYRWAGQGMEAGAVEFEQSLEMPEVPAAAKRSADVARQFGRVATEDMTDFRWLSLDGTVQQTAFGNGASVIANFGAEPFRAFNGAVVPPMAAISV
ncbi:MAG: hypothetical protein PHU85_03645 [Phycisphaerae bacterium]|nr:hypothetical protein [Phycisphaerae bacterium]